MREIERWRYVDVPRLGTVLLSADALASLKRDSVTPSELVMALRLGTDTKAVGKPYSGTREYNGIRLLFKTRPHLKGAAAVCIDGYRVKP